MLISGGRQREFSVYVNSIPEELDRWRVTSAYIPWRKIRRQRTRFGFVRFYEEEGAIRSTKLFNNANIRGRRLQEKILTGEINTESEERLKRSLVCTTEESKDLATLSSAIIYGYEALMEEALSNHEELDLWFSDIQRWNKYDSCETRKVWLEVFGVPPRGRMWENFKRISELWGRLITLGKSIACTESFESMKMLVVTDMFYQIEEKILLTIDDKGHRVIVREIGPAIQQHIYAHPQNLAPNESTGHVPGFEDIEEDHSEECNSNRHEGSSHSEAQQNEEAQEAPFENWNSNLNSEVQKPQGNRRTSSESRAKTADFSHNGYLE
ncbi:hypothetical protein Cgig2_012589 [Carnegiea gigantea]|uniref:RRM domain-containing protein n=1 Tax=Carnegiea gigantea TaxID=171969 RepID=A0A9Q1Q9T9_9CARY|nr:hypothetical protein Cgig2_012589 [Carnegiea gigantea]